MLNSVDFGGSVVLVVVAAAVIVAVAGGGVGGGVGVGGGGGTGDCAFAAALGRVGPGYPLVFPTAARACVRVCA